MALPKSSFYVWFLGAKVSGGIRGDEHVRSAVRHLVDRERRVEPLKVTLQVSGKGVKMVRPVSASAPLTSAPLKHLIPDDALAFASQSPPPDDDIVGAIVLSDEKWPAHVHVFRCDSPETAALLCSHLSALADRPHHQRRLTELEARLAPHSTDQRKHRPQADHSLRRTLSDGRSVRTESTPSSASPTPSSSSAESAASTSEGVAARRSSIPAEGWPSPELADERVVALYDSLAAELRAVLGSGRNSPLVVGPDGRCPGAVRAPILLPPRDYDTVHRMRGRVDGVDERRCLTSAVVGMTSTSGKTVPPGNPIIANGSSGKSSGFGSDEAPGSPTRGPPSSSEKSDDDWESRPFPVTVARRLRSSSSAAARIPLSRDRDKMAPTMERRAVSTPQHRSSRFPDHSYRELPDGKRYPGLDRDTAKPALEIDNNRESRDRYAQRQTVSRQNGTSKKIASKMVASDQQPEKRYYRYNERTEWMPAVCYR